mmetsp:Transcript_7077/g.16078  ORF Transcript_7077/g.16078 Transcript_7077/m.16078 type:complete len:307 (-) Transcript_7077:11-931(-)
MLNFLSRSLTALMSTADLEVFFSIVASLLSAASVALPFFFFFFLFFLVLALGEGMGIDGCCFSHPRFTNPGMESDESLEDWEDSSRCTNSGMPSPESLSSSSSFSNSTTLSSSIESISSSLHSSDDSDEESYLTVLGTPRLVGFTGLVFLCKRGGPPLLDPDDDPSDDDDDVSSRLASGGMEYDPSLLPSLLEDAWESSLLSPRLTSLGSFSPSLEAEEREEDSSSEEELEEEVGGRGGPNVGFLGGVDIVRGGAAVVVVVVVVRAAVALLPGRLAVVLPPLDWPPVGGRLFPLLFFLFAMVGEGW